MATLPPPPPPPAPPCPPVDDRFAGSECRRTMILLACVAWCSSWISASTSLAPFTRRKE